MSKITILFLFSTLSFHFFKNPKPSPSFEFETGWYMVTDSVPNSKLLKFKYSNQSLFIQRTPILLAKNYSEINITTLDFGGEDFIVLELIYDGLEKLKWATTTERMLKTHEHAVFVYQDQILAEVLAIYKIENGYATVSNKHFTRAFLNSVETNIKKSNSR